MIFVLYLFAVFLGFFLQLISNWNVVTKVISNASMFLSYVFTILIQISEIMDIAVEYTGLSKTVIIVTIVLFYGSCTFSFAALRLTYINKLKKQAEYSDYLIKSKIQEILDGLKLEIMEKTDIFGDNFFISMFLVNGIIKKKINRLGHSGDMHSIPSSWDGKITNIKGCTTGIVIEGKKPHVVNFLEFNNEFSLKSLPNDLRMWSMDYLSYRICMPITERIKYPLRKETDIVRLILSISCVDRSKNYSSFGDSENGELDEVCDMVESYAKQFKKYYDYYKYMV